MNKNKKMRMYFFLPIFILFIGITSCKKYEDGPMISLRTKTERLSNTWKVDNYKVNDTDLTSILSGYTETFTKDKNYSYDWGILNGSGTWKFQSNNNEVLLTGNDDQSSRTLVILKLEENSFWYKYDKGNDHYEIHLVTK
jgi:hypothetical protein